MGSETNLVNWRFTRTSEIKDFTSKRSRKNGDEMRRAQRSRSVKRVKRVLPGGKTVYHFRKKKVGKHKCSCGAKLNRPSLRAIKLKKIPKNQCRANRPLANLCSKCAREKLRKRVRRV